MCNIRNSFTLESTSCRYVYSLISTISDSTFGIKGSIEKGQGMRRWDSRGQRVG